MTYPSSHDPWPSTPVEQPGPANWGAPPRRRWGLIVAIAVAVLVVAVGLGVAFALGRNSGNLPAALGSSSSPTAASPTPQLITLGDQAECALLVPTLQDAANLVLAIAAHPDGSTVDRTKLDKTITDLKTERQTASSTMQPDIDQQIAPLVDLQSVLSGAGNRTLSFTDMRTSGLRLATHCQQYATG